MAAVLATVVAVAAACGDSSSHSGSRGSSSTSAPAVTTTSGASFNIGIICSSPRDAAMSLVDAWVAGDRGAAARCATPGAVATIFATSGADARWTFEGCDLSDPGVPVCTYRYSGGSAKLTIEGTEARGWMVTKLVR